MVSGRTVNGAAAQPACLALAAVRMLRPNASPRGGGGKSDEPNFSFLVTLLTMLDFSEPGKVTQEDWDRGMGNLWAPGVGSAVSWGSLLKRFDKGGSGQIDFGEIIGLWLRSTLGSGGPAVTCISKNQITTGECCKSQINEG